jgi:hypothetical protein
VREKELNSPRHYPFVMSTLSLLYALSLINILFDDVFKYLFWVSVIILNSYVYYTFSVVRGAVLLGCCSFGLFLFLSLYGIERDNFVSYVYFDIIIFSFFSFLFFFNQRNSYQWFVNEFPKNVSLWLSFGLIVSWFLFIKSDLQPGTSDVRFSIGDSIKEFGGAYKVIEPLSPALFVAPFYRSIKSKWRYSIVLSLVTILVFSIFTATRGTFIISLISILYLLIINLKRTDWFRKLMQYFAFVCIGFLLLLFVFSLADIRDSLELLRNRFLDSKDFSSGRDDESRLFLASLTETEWIIGRGMGGTQETWIWRHLKDGLNMVHYGHLQLLLKGGLLLLISIYVLITYCLLRAIRNAKMLFPFFYMVIVFFIYDQFHTQWQRVFSVLFLWLACSAIVFCNVSLNEKRKTSS